MYYVMQLLDISSFFTAFVLWLHSLTPWQIAGLFSFMIIDVARNVGKTISLSLFKIKRHFRPLKISKAAVGNPKISLLIAAHNESSSITKTIKSALEMTYSNKEIIIIDDHSTDDTYQQALPYFERGLIKLVKRSGGKGSRAAAINYGSNFATGDILMMTDADTLLDRSALSEVAKYLSLPTVAGILGNVRILSGDKGVTNLLTRCQSYEYLVSFELGRRVRTLLNVLVIIPGAFGALRTERAKKMALYDIDTVTEDFDLTLKLFKSGGKIEFIPEVIAYTYCPNNWKAWIRQRVRWSHGQVVTLLKHRDIITTRNVKYDLWFVFGVFDMIFMDIILLFARTISMIWILFYFTQSIEFVFILVFLVYFISELIIILAAGIFSPIKSDLKYIYLLPFMLFIYRPFYAYIRLYAFIRALMGKGVDW
jgi:cellulose synthase/poly-beta-1,6-N-acetylglucosamine synthase-like glycosyltransferase